MWPEFETNDWVRYRGRYFRVVVGESNSRPSHVIIEDDEGGALMVHVSEVSQA